MTPPEALGKGKDAGTPSATPAVSLLILRKRAEFLAVAQGRRQGTAGFLLQALPRPPALPGRPAPPPEAVRIGFTASKKIGNAVLRNRAKRRLRALARQVLCEAARPGWDYVLVARPDSTVARPYADLVADLGTALASVHRAKDRPSSGQPRDMGGKALMPNPAGRTD